MTLTPKQLNFCNHPHRDANPKVNLHQPLGGSSCGASGKQSWSRSRSLGGRMPTFPGSTFIPCCSHYVTAPCPIPARAYTRAGQEAALDTPVTPRLLHTSAGLTQSERALRAAQRRELPARTRTAAPRGEHPARALQTQLAQTFTCLAATAGIRTGLFSECFSMSLPCATCTEMFVLAIGQIFQRSQISKLFPKTKGQ